MAGINESISVAPGWLWLSFSIGVFVLLFVDLALFHRTSHKVTTRMALLESFLWISVALLFNAWFWMSYGHDLGLQFLTGYLVEKSLSVDNLFVILLIFSSFRVPAEYHHRVLFYGVLGAVIMRGTLILIGASLLHTFDWILYFFGVILVVTAIKFLMDSDEEVDAKENWSVRLIKKVIPVSSSFDGPRFFTTESGVHKATPLFLALIVIEATDLVFAVDSIPAVFAVTRDAFVAYASNILALLGLRALYFVLADWVTKLRYLKPGLAAILGFIGVKMLIAEVFHIPSWISLMVIIAILSTAALSSWYVSRIENRKASNRDPFAH